jgi:transcriptional regulator with XRE-family HTH domain
VTTQSFGLEIKLLRERQKVSAKDLAKRVGLSPSQMSRLETGQRRVDAVLLSKIARALDVHPSHFFSGFDDKAPVHSRERTDGDHHPRLAAPSAQLGKILRAERRRRHLTAEELAHKVGKGKTFVQDVEAGRTDLVSGETLQKIAKVLKLDTEVLLEAQRGEIRELRRSLARLERAHTERTLGELELEGPGATKRGLPLVEGEGGGLPWHFDKGIPEGRVLDYLYVPGVRVQRGFAVTWSGDEMEAPQPPSFARGEILIFAADREPRHRDFVLAVLEGRSVFRQLFLDPKGRVRLQPLNLDFPPLTLERDEVRELFLLAARLITV